jgi:hypothetical protein
MCLSLRINRDGTNFLITLHQKERTFGGTGNFHNFFQHIVEELPEPEALLAL